MALTQAEKSYEERLRETFDVTIIAGAYVDSGYMDDEGFSRVFEQAVTIRALRIEGLDWLLFDQLLSTTPDIPLDVHFRALSAGMKRPYRGIEAFYRQLIEIELFHPALLNRTHFHHVPRPGQPLGEVMLQLGLLSPVTLQRGLGIKEIIRQRAGIDVAVGQIFRSVGRVSIVDFFQALGVQVGIELESLDASAANIYRAAMQRHHRRSERP